METNKAVSLSPAELERLAQSVEDFTSDKPAVELDGSEEILEMTGSTTSQKEASPLSVGPLFGEVGSIAELQDKLNEMIPDKMAFKIGEVSEITNIKPYVLRYWESEFETLSPQKSAFNQRMYTRRDVENVLLIKKLLYEDKFSIAGAKKKLKELKRELRAEKQWDQVQGKYDRAIERIQELISDIQRIKALFS